MIGYKSDKYRDFGWAAARIDDLVNLIPARLTGYLIALAASLSSKHSGREALRAMGRDAPTHLSPNAGWPEAALAGALAIRLGGARSYQGRRVDLPTMGDGRGKIERQDIEQALKIYNTGLNILTGLVILACIINWSV
jgi:adenosylcobinamide-phosphate synthase